MPAPIRLTAVMTHPVQYLAPWFRWISARCPEIALEVLYGIKPNPVQQGMGFARPFEWDVPLTEGYRSRTIRTAESGDDLSSERFFGLDVKEIGAAVRSTTPDAVLVTGWHSITQARAMLACVRSGIPLVYRGENMIDRVSDGWRGRLRRVRTALLLSRFKACLSIGSQAHAYLRAHGVPESRIFPSPYGVDNAFFAAEAERHDRAAVRASFGIAPGEFVTLFVGKLDDNKRPDELIRAVGRLKRRARVLLVGSGPRDAECKAEAERSGALVSWAGFLNQRELGRAYAAADCLVLPSTRETWGLVVNEALASGLPCVVSDGVGCGPDLVIPGETGALFPVGDVSVLSGALEHIAAASAAGRDWAPACRARAHCHSFEAATAGLLAACRAVTTSR